MTLPTVEGGFGTVVADPPWPYRDANKDSSTLTKPLRKITRQDGTLAKQVNDWTYAPMPLDEILHLPVRTIVAKNAHLYLWTTNAFMEQAHQVARAWGFEPKTILTWVKTKHNDPSKPSMKTGYWFRGATEHVVFATRGSCPKPTVALPTAFGYPRIGEHSRKPEGFYTRYVERISPGPRLEMFSRTTREGWVVWGNQVPTEEPELMLERI
jgi:N6-adenosine-specific RNA methylase IME4